MFIRRKTYQALINRVETLEQENKQRAVETHKNADRYHELAFQLDAEVVNRDIVELPVEGEEDLVVTVSIQDVLKAITAHLGMSLKVKREAECIVIEDELLDVKVFFQEGGAEDVEDS